MLKLFGTPKRAITQKEIPRAVIQVERPAGDLRRQARLMTLLGIFSIKFLVGLLQ